MGSVSRMNNKTPTCTFGRGVMTSSGSLRATAAGVSAETSRGVSSSAMVSE